jgi:hypothetical protein
VALDDGHDGTLLDSRRSLKAVGVDYDKALSGWSRLVEGASGKLTATKQL